jgi:sulfur carrier protein
MGKTVRIRLNGEEREVPEGTTVGRLADDAAPDRARLAVERNRRVVPRADYDRARVEEGDVLEIVTLAGGG